MCYWAHLDGVHVWTLWRPLYKLLRFWWVGREIHNYVLFFQLHIYVIDSFNFTETAYHNKWNAEADMRIQVFIFKPDIKHIGKYVK